MCSGSVSWNPCPDFVIIKNISVADKEGIVCIKISIGIIYVCRYRYINKLMIDDFTSQHPNIFSIFNGQLPYSLTDSFMIGMSVFTPYIVCNYPFCR